MEQNRTKQKTETKQKQNKNRNEAETKQNKLTVNVNVLQGVQDGFHEFKVQGGQLVVKQLQPFQGVQVVEGVRWDLGYAEIHIKQ